MDTQFCQQVNLFVLLATVPSIRDFWENPLHHSNFLSMLSLISVTLLDSDAVNETHTLHKPASDMWRSRSPR